MKSTVYLNPNFVPNNQASFYRSDLDEYLKKQDETSELILTKLQKQNVFMYNQYHGLRKLLLTSNEQYSALKNEQNKLLKSIQSISNVTISNKHCIQRALELAKNSSYCLQQVKDKLDETYAEVKRMPVKLKYVEEKIVNHLISEMNTLENNVVNEMSNKFNSAQDYIINDILTELDAVTEKFENHLVELSKQPICELFEALNPGTKVNKLIISGSSINVATFINFEKATQQVKFVMADGNLLAVNCKDVEAVEINTKTSTKNS